MKIDIELPNEYVDKLRATIATLIQQELLDRLVVFYEENVDELRKKEIKKWWNMSVYDWQIAIPNSLLMDKLSENKNDETFIKMMHIYLFRVVLSFCNTDIQEYIQKLWDKKYK